jgi:hypothetical protein
LQQHVGGPAARRFIVAEEILRQRRPFPFVVQGDGDPVEQPESTREYQDTENQVKRLDFYFFNLQVIGSIVALKL